MHNTNGYLLSGAVGDGGLHQDLVVLRVKPLDPGTHGWCWWLAFLVGLCEAVLYPDQYCVPSRI